MAFHSHDGWHWERLLDGSVRVSKEVPGDSINESGTLEHVVTADTWASIVASVSAGGEINGRFYAAKAFHADEQNAEIRDLRQCLESARADNRMYRERLGLKP